ncbi:hypothetical protein K469DRAFT_736268 [Zopfia rhizophila CBS 207.26]|uniref:Uncharacterized protein n=1 Tax=Zopfia rhizophila CBS 207.26 TaxID=1314779 RepID=A0A6A6EHS7_9PEZI|nr:hypothetical protein K469DRAFT_736268 [Zopfia rhizophila CBS 207.26]
MNKMDTKNRDPPKRPLTTFALTLAALILGIPIAAAALVLEKVPIPTVILGSKTINAGPNTTKTISFSLLSGLNDAVMAGAYISIISSILVVVGLVLTRHVSKHNIFGWTLIGPAIANALGQVACLAYVFIVQGQHPEAKSTEEVRYVDGKYDTDGKLYTREAWACMMDKLYKEREGEWAEKACSELKTGRFLTIPLLATSILLLTLAFWQIRRQGGLGWLFGRRKHVERVMAQSKTEYIGLQG